MFYKEIKIYPGQELYFTSDTHYNHTNICSATTTWKNPNGVVREFNSLEEMDETIVNGINSVVGPDDILIHLGDWSFNGIDNISKFRNLIYCKTIYIIPGNHDHHIHKNVDNVHDVFTEVWSQITLLNIKRKESLSKNARTIDKYNLCLSHYPIHSWPEMNKNNYHIHGHVHLPPEHIISDGRSIDVGADGNNYKPWSITEIDNLLSNKPIKRLSIPIDHHEKEL